jgi:NitT/TauT family transport system substrate-binding protein
MRSAFWLLLLAFAAHLTAVCPLLAAPLKIGVLPVLDTLPLHVAARDELFAKRGLEVELVNFSSALERDVAMQGGQLDGYFGDLLNSLLLIQSGVPMRIFAVAYATQPGQRMFALLAAPGSTITDLQSAKDARVGISSATIIEYLLDSMLEKSGIPKNAVTPVEVKKIPIRLQMLLSGQLDLALLPEPLVSVAQSSGAGVLLTDENLDMPLTVLSLHQSKLEPGRKVLEPFLEAYRQAIQRIAARPETYRMLMAEACGIPESLQPGFKIPVYPAPQLPTAAALRTVQNWMVEHGLLQQSLPYDRLVPAALNTTFRPTSPHEKAENPPLPPFGKGGNAGAVFRAAGNSGTAFFEVGNSRAASREVRDPGRFFAEAASSKGLQ